LPVYSVLFQGIDGACIPSDCDDGNPCTLDACVANECQNAQILCNDNNPCTDDTCVNGQCVFTPICTITNTQTPAPSISAVPTSLTPSFTSSPFQANTRSVTPSPNEISLTSTRSRIPLNPSSPSQVINPSSSATGGNPSGFPIQSNSASPEPSVTRSLTATRTTSRSVTAEPSQSPGPIPTSVPSASPSNLLIPSASSSSIPATPLPFRVGAPVPVLVQLQCSSSCCSSFVDSWAALERINSPVLMDLLTCDSINNNLLSVTYDQFGSNLHDVNQVLGAYWVDGGCGNSNPFRDGPCFPTQGLLSSNNWNSVIEIEVLTGNYQQHYNTSVYINNGGGGGGGNHHKHSSSTVLVPSFFLLLCFLLL